MKTKIFCDIADFKVIKHYNKKKIVDGFTTNPSLIRLAGAKNYKNYCLKILKICKKKPISFEVFADKPEDMLSQAYKINKWGKNIYVKIPIENSKGQFMGKLIQELNDFSAFQLPFSMTLNGFAAFKPRVIYIDVVKTRELISIQKSLMSRLESSLNIVHPVSKKRPFTPHLTVGFRDLSKKNFYQAWEEFKEKELYYNFRINELTLLIHNGRIWEIHSEYKFNLT